MQRDLFAYEDYKKYLADKIADRPNGGRGERSKIASVLRCHIAYISQVLNGNAQLSLEQADLLNDYLGHSEAEADYFLLLVQVARCGTKSLRDRYLRKVEEIKKARALLKNRLQYQKELSPEIQPIYYSAWYYTAIHFLLAVPSLQTKDALSEHLNLPLTLVGQVLDFLISAGLAVQKGNRFQMGTSRIHLGSDSPLISKHHTNWRLQALQSLEECDPHDLHYSSVLVVDRKQLPILKEILVKAIEQMRNVMKPNSPFEGLYCYTLDLFEVGKRRAQKNTKSSSNRRLGHEESISSRASH